MTVDVVRPGLVGSYVAVRLLSLHRTTGVVQRARLLVAPVVGVPVGDIPALDILE
jgi:hypothetical protein